MLLKTKSVKEDVPCKISSVLASLACTPLIYQSSRESVWILEKIDGFSMGADGRLKRFQICSTDYVRAPPPESTISR